MEKVAAISLSSPLPKVDEDVLDLQRAGTDLTWKQFWSIVVSLQVLSNFPNIRVLIELHAASEEESPYCAL